MGRPNGGTAMPSARPPNPSLRRTVRPSTPASSRAAVCVPSPGVAQDGAVRQRRWGAPLGLPRGAHTRSPAAPSQAASRALPSRRCPAHRMSWSCALEPSTSMPVAPRGVKGLPPAGASAAPAPLCRGPCSRERQRLASTASGTGNPPLAACPPSAVSPGSGLLSYQTGGGLTPVDFATLAFFD